MSIKHLLLVTCYDIPFVVDYIFKGENPAAMQTGTSHKQSSSPLLLVLFILTGLQHLQKKAHN